jgi:hypothetical protein
MIFLQQHNSRARLPEERALVLTLDGDDKVAVH